MLRSKDQWRFFLGKRKKEARRDEPSRGTRSLTSTSARSQNCERKAQRTVQHDHVLLRTREFLQRVGTASASIHGRRAAGRTHSSQSFRELSLADARCPKEEERGDGSSARMQSRTRETNRLGDSRDGRFLSDDTLAKDRLEAEEAGTVAAQEGRNGNSRRLREGLAAGERS